MDPAAPHRLDSRVVRFVECVERVGCELVGNRARRQAPWRNRGLRPAERESAPFVKILLTSGLVDNPATTSAGVASVRSQRAPLPVLRIRLPRNRSDRRGLAPRHGRRDSRDVGRQFETAQTCKLIGSCESKPAVLQPRSSTALSRADSYEPVGSLLSSDDKTVNDLPAIVCTSELQAVLHGSGVWRGDRPCRASSRMPSTRRRYDNLLRGGEAGHASAVFSASTRQHRQFAGRGHRQGTSQLPVLMPAWCPATIGSISTFK